jgi:anti-anti-sigma factor
VLFEARTDPLGDWAVVRVIGEIDLASLPSLRQEVDRTDGDRLALDLTDVDYVDPVALGVVVAGSVRMARRGGRFAVICPPGGPRDLLAESGLDRILAVVAGADDLPGAGPATR